MRRGLKRVPVSKGARAKASKLSLPAPVRGWVTAENLALAGPAAALVLENGFPLSNAVRVRGGTAKYATVSATGAATSLWRYSNAFGEQMFAATNDSVFDISSIADADAIPTAAVTGQTSGYYSVAQIGTAGGDYQFCCNGTDDPLLYDGSTFTAINGASTPAITFSSGSATTASLSAVWTYANRAWFVEGGSMNAWYLPIDSIGGVANSVSLAGVFSQGGELLFGTRWSLDSGAGLDDKCIFVSTRGEVAVYEGSDPSSADSWGLVGVYQLSPPLGKNAYVQIGGEVMILTGDGMVPISQATQRDAAQLSLAAISKPIELDWKAAAAARISKAWEAVKWPAGNMLVVTQPIAAAGQTAECLVCNIETGAWGKYTAHDTECITEYRGRVYFGTSGGLVKQMETGGSDDGEPYTFVYVGHFDHLGNPGQIKTATMARAIFRASHPFNYTVSASVNYTVSLPAAPSSVADFTTDTWDVGEWDVAQWSVEEADAVTTTEWRSIGQTGFAHAPQIQITCGVAPLPSIKLAAIDLMYISGEVVG